jgi:hypothetical protein
MRGAPGYRDWVTRVRALAGEPELASVREPLEALASNSLENLDPFNNFIQAHGSSIQIEDLWRASERIEQAIPEEALSALLASTVVLMLWSVREGEQLYGQINGMPQTGWAQFPYVCASAALKSGAPDEALRLVERSLDVLIAAKYKDHPRYQAAVARYRKLGVAVETSWRGALQNLAADLRDSCCLEQPNFRAEVGALLWTLGMIPESSLFLPRVASPGLPPIRVCRQIIHVSHIGMARDPLTQYIWLEMKDREPFNIRDHPVFFGLANLRYNNHLLDEVMPEPPSRLFAKTIISWFRGDLDEELAGRYVESYRLVETEFPSQVDWPIYFRMRMLACMVGEQFGWIKNESPAASLETTQDMANQAASVNRNAFLHPEWPALYTRTSGPVFAMMDKLAAASTPASAFFSVLEGFRAASMNYWLTAAPPLPSAAEQAAAATLIEKENRLLIELKGAYFLILAPTLPMHYRRAGSEIDPNDPSSLKYPDTSQGLDQYARILGELAELHAQMQPVAPEYARRRTVPIADIASLAQALGMHRNRS